MIPQAFIDDLLGRVDIVALVQRFLSLKKAGANYIACCPFHQEKTPSFTVSAAKQFYYCFGCGARGDALGFLMEYQGVSFVSAVEQVAAEMGLVLPQSTNSELAAVQSVVTPLFEALLKAERFYRGALKNNPAAILYLKQRGLSGDIAARFGLGFAPNTWQALSAIFKDYAQSDVLLNAGLVIEKHPATRYDRFRDRIIFPIYDTKSQVIGFGGRLLGVGDPKYLNSPETPVFIKGQTLYGLHQARQAIQRAAKALVVEGYMDVVALAQFGVSYAVATLGTATTAEQLKQLLRYTEHLIFCFDGDAAGQQAAWRALEQLLPLLTDAVRADFLMLPAGEDPDSLIRKVGPQAFEALLIERAQPLSQWMQRALWERVSHFGSAEAKARVWHEAKPLLSRIQAPTLRNALWEEFRSRTGYSKRALPPKGLSAERWPPATLAARVQLSLLRKPHWWTLVSEQRPVNWAHCGFEPAGLALIHYLEQTTFSAPADTAALMALCPAWSAAWSRWLSMPWAELIDWDDPTALAEFREAWQQLLNRAQTFAYAEEQLRLDEKAKRQGFQSLSAAERIQYTQLTAVRRAVVAPVPAAVQQKKY